MKFIPSFGKYFKKTPLFIGIAYALLSAAWILFTDVFLAKFIRNPEVLTEYQTIKGWFFVLITAALLYFFIRRAFKKIENATEALIESENKYRTILEQAVEGIMITDSYGNIRETNNAATDILGYTPAVFYTLNIRDLVQKEDLDEQPLHFKDLYSGNAVHSERHLIRQDGSIISCEISAKMLSTGYIGIIFRDISKRKQIESELRESEQEYRLLFRNNPHPMWVYDTESLKFLAVNNTALSKYGYSLEEFTSMTIKDIRPKEEVPLLEKNLRTNRTDNQISGPWKHMKKDGSIFFVEITSNALTFRGSKARLVLANDISERKRAIEALEENEKRFRNLFEQSPISIWEEDLSIIKNHIDLLKRTGVTDFNKYLEQYPEEIVNSLSKVKILDINTATMDLYETDDKEELLKLLSAKSRRSLQSQRESIIAISEGRKHFEFEKEIETVKGSIKYVGLKWTVADGYESTYSKVFVSLMDITQRKTAEEALKARNRNLQEIIDASALPIYALDLEGKVVFGWNKAAEELFGWTFEEVKNKIPLIIPEEEYNRFHTFQKSILAGNKVTGAEVVRKTKDGRLLTLIYSGAPLRNDTGIIHSSITILSDVTQRKEFEQELRQSERKFRELSDSITDVFFAIDRDARITYWNKACESITGMHSREVLNRGLFEILPELKATDIYNILTAPDIQHSEHIAQSLRINNNEYYFDIYIYPSLNGFSVFAKDMTELNRTSEELRALNEELEQRVMNRTLLLESSNKELEAFAYSVSHDLRAPLRRIDGFINILQEENTEYLSPHSKSMIESVLKNVREMQSLIDALLSFSRYAAKELTLKKVDMSGMARHIIDELAGFEKNRKINITVNVLPSVYADGNLIQQVWTNLISNALKFTRKVDEPAILIDSYREDGFIVYKVSDNGIGFNSLYTYKLFDVFQRLHKKDEFEGTGVGLAIVKRIVTRHGGKVWAESEQGKGACFYFSLPELPEIQHQI